MSRPAEQDPAAPHLYAASVTPFAGDGRLDLEAFEQHLDRLVSAGVDGVVVAGTTGETTTLCLGEKVDLVRAAREAVGLRAVVVAGTGERDTTEGIAEARALMRAGAGGLLVSAPAACRPSQAGLLAHVRAIADASDAPVMLYDNPRRFGVGFAVETLAAAEQHPNIWAVKDATDDPDRPGQVAEQTGLAWFAGSDGSAATLGWGGYGLVGVGVNVDPAAYRAYLNALRGWDTARAAQCGDALDPLVRALHAHVPPAVATKVVLRALGLLPCARVRLPLVGPTPVEAAAIRRDLTAYDGLWQARPGAVPLGRLDDQGGALQPPETVNR
ncbi:MAG: dihydrodipicolinate synthase family protein [Promicromonosporaceae bacterium]|nr:dihydrodipicolinate synthase family protein [Promicromonosporaceae bacterium]